MGVDAAAKELRAAEAQRLHEIYRRGGGGG